MFVPVVMDITDPESLENQNTDNTTHRTNPIIITTMNVKTLTDANTTTTG